MPDWYKTHSASPDCYSDAEYREWAQDNGLYVDLAGNVDYGPPDGYETGTYTQELIGTHETEGGYQLGTEDDW